MKREVGCVGCFATVNVPISQMPATNHRTQDTNSRLSRSRPASRVARRETRTHTNAWPSRDAASVPAVCSACSIRCVQCLSNRACATAHGRYPLGVHCAHGGHLVLATRRRYPPELWRLCARGHDHVLGVGTKTAPRAGRAGAEDGIQVMTAPGVRTLC